MDDELLIELVRNHPVLYDLSQPKYMDSNFKQDIWNKIGEEMKVDAILENTDFTVYGSTTDVCE